MTEELKLCPFCNSPAKFDIITRYDRGPYGSGNRYFEYRVICPSCKIQTKIFDEGEQEQAIAAWNTRHCTVLDETSKDPVCLQIIPTEALKAELNRRDEYNESGELPEWLIETIELGIKYAIINADANQNKPVLHAKLLHAKFLALRESLEWVLSLRKQGESE